MITTALLAVSGLPSFSVAVGPDDPEIVDRAGDAAPSAFFLNAPDTAPAFENLTAYDVVSAYVVAESEDNLYLQIAVQDLPDSWDLPPEIPSDGTGPLGPGDTSPAVHLVANFTLRGRTYEAAARLSQPSASGLVDAYELRSDGLTDPIAGAYDAYNDTVLLGIPKGLLDGPRPGEVLSRFRAEGRFDEAKLDFAPDAADAPPSAAGGAQGLLTIVLHTLRGEQVVQPRFGRDYVFGTAPTGGNGDLLLSAPETARAVAAGGSVAYAVKLLNVGTFTHTVYLTLSTSAPGTAHRVSDARVVLGPGSERTLDVTVTTSASAAGTFPSVLTATSTLGDSARVTLTTTVQGSGRGGANGDTPTGVPSSSLDDPGADGFRPPGGKRSGTPGFEAMVLVAAALAACALARRRGA